MLLLGQHPAEEYHLPAEFRRAATVTEGLEIADREGPFDVAVVDLMLPDGSGTDVVREVKMAHPETRVAVLGSVRDLSVAFSAGADEAMGKRTPLQEIVSRLASLAGGGGWTAA